VRRVRTHRMVPVKPSPEHLNGMIFRSEEYRCAARCRLRTSWTVHVQDATIRQFDNFKETHVWTVPRHGAGDAHFCSGLQDLRRDPDAAQLRDAVRLADIISSSPVLVDGGDMQITVRVPRCILCHCTKRCRPSWLSRAVMRCRIPCRKHTNDDANSGSA
jgi:hypothetical protein